MFIQEKFSNVLPNWEASLFQCETAAALCSTVALGLLLGWVLVTPHLHAALGAHTISLNNYCLYHTIWVAAESMSGAGALISITLMFKINSISSEVKEEAIFDPTLEEKDEIFWSTPLVQAAKIGDLDKVKELLLRGADINAQDRNGNTALHEAVLQDNSDLVKLLLVNPKINVHLLNSEGQDALELAEQNRKTPVADILAADPRFHNIHFAIRYGKLERMNQILTKNPSAIEKPNRYGDHPLHTAIIYNRLDCVKALLKAGADVNARGYKNNTALHYSNERSYASGETRIYDELLTFDPELNVFNSKGFTPDKNPTSYAWEERLDLRNF